MPAKENVRFIKYSEKLKKKIFTDFNFYVTKLIKSENFDHGFYLTVQELKIDQWYGVRKMCKN